MKHLTFSIVSALLGLNVLVISAQTESNSVPEFEHYDFSDVLSQTVENDNGDTPYLPIPRFTLFPSRTPQTNAEVQTSNSDNTNEGKVEAYNTKSEKQVGSVSVNGVNNSKALIPCSNPEAKCDPSPTQTPTPTASPTYIPTVTPTPIPTITLEPEPTIIHPSYPPCRRWYPVESHSEKLERVPDPEIIIPCPEF